jgi:hypothetical protein
MCEQQQNYREMQEAVMVYDTTVPASAFLEAQHFLANHLTDGSEAVSLFSQPAVPFRD